ncbi:MAG TPA: 16S rRNA (guanine(966)-N(2))-methyltransferase RsmD [Haliangiales bacterium]|nr:16S rRNA (guanine(966)-N(2))-methyltransferase RsmD [Haliangiales bacterium]
MRIIGGSLGGRRLRAPRGLATRPTGDRVREAIFNILGPPPDGARILDLFAGAGGLGLEALSRGAAEATFVDASAPACRAIDANARELGLAGRVRVIRGDVHRVLARLDERFDWVFLDPPYAGDDLARALGALPPASVVIAEHDRRRPPATNLSGRSGGLALSDRRRYGDTEVSFYREIPP